MDQYDNPKVSLEAEHPPKPEENWDYALDDVILEGLLPAISNNDGLGIEVDGGNIDESEEDEDDEDEKDEEAERYCFHKPDRPRGFLLQPSWYNVYYDLKLDNPERAIKYLERLLDFGALGIEPPRMNEEDRLVYNLLDGPMNVIDKAYVSYCRTRNAERKRAEEERRKKLSAEMDKRSKQRRRRYGN